MKITSSILFALLFLVSCSEDKISKVLVISSGNFDVSENNITMKGGSSHNEKEVSIIGDKITLTTDGGNKQDFNVGEKGYYVLNLKKDTLVGSYQRVGTETNQQVISQEDLKLRVDSLNQLMAGQNVSASKRNFAIAPQQIQKITENLNAQIIGPFKRVPGSFEAGKEHEIYKFYTNKEMREIVVKLQGMMSDPEAEE